MSGPEARGPVRSGLGAASFLQAMITWVILELVTKFLGPLDIAVVGCGVAGQAAATLLAERGHRVTIYERFTEPQPIGAGLLLQPTGLAVLRELGLADASDRARRARCRARGAHPSRPLHPRPALRPSASPGARRRHPSRHFVRPAARPPEQSPAKLVTGAEIVDVDQTHLVEESGARHGPFDLIVAADGAHSALRTRLMPHARAPLYPWGCMWTTVPDPSGIGAAGLLRQRVRGTRLMMGLLPVGRDEVTIYWSLPIRALGRSKTIDLAAWRRTATALWPEAAAIIDQCRGRRLCARDLSPCRAAPLERGPGAVHRRRRARHQPAARPGRQSRPDGCLGAGRDARRRARASLRLPALRAAAQSGRALLPPRQPSPDAVLPVAPGAARLAARRLHGAGAPRAGSAVDDGVHARRHAPRLAVGDAARATTDVFRSMASSAAARTRPAPRRTRPVPPAC